MSSAACHAPVAVHRLPRRRSLPAMAAALLSLALMPGLQACDPSRAESMRTLGEGISRFQQNDAISALRLFERAAEQDPSNAQAHHLVGLVLLQTYNNAGAAVEHLARAVELDDDEPDHHYQLGIALGRIGERTEAMNALRATVERDPNHARALYRLGRLQLQGGETTGAISTFTRAIHADPLFEQPWNALGNLYFDRGRPQEALAVFENAILINPEATSVYADVGRVYLAMGESDAAIEFLREASQHRGAPEAVHYNLGVSLRTRYEQSGRPSDRDDAIRSLTRALGQCNALADRTRCSSIQRMITELQRGGN